MRVFSRIPLLEGFESQEVSFGNVSTSNADDSCCLEITLTQIITLKITKDYKHREHLFTHRFAANIVYGDKRETAVFITAVAGATAHTGAEGAAFTCFLFSITGVNFLGRHKVTCFSLQFLT